MTNEEFEQLPADVQLAELIGLAMEARYHWKDAGQGEQLRHLLRSMSNYDLNHLLTSLEETTVQVRDVWRDRLQFE